MRRWLKKELSSGAAAVDDSSSSSSPRVIVFCDLRRPLDTLADVLSRDFNGIVWKEGYGTQQEGHDAVISILRADDTVGARAAAMMGFHGPDDNGQYSSYTGNDRNGNDGVASTRRQSSGEEQNSSIAATTY